MKIEYDSECDALYIQLNRRRRITLIACRDIDEGVAPISTRTVNHRH